ncbi:MAG: carbohydrate ABC transporter permease [Defluviitaleaceae bacterium]|nr:carbohydrate ABC transporter permease [Defluviitaleaceae bacterium]MCL2263299.1 carbohydrate ABC transporter permease [Defluviitaleaceae bacterium]
MENVNRRKYGFSDIIRDPRGWRESPSFDSTMHKWTGKIRDFIVGVCIAIIVIGVCYVILGPIFGIVSRAIMTREDVINPLIFLIPQNFTTASLNYAITHMNYFGVFRDIFVGLFSADGTFSFDYVLALREFSNWGALFGTLIFAGFFSLLHVMVCSMIGYGFARFKYPGVNALFALVIITIVVPVHSYMVPMFINFRFFFGTDINLINSWWALGLLTATGVGLRSGLYIYIFRQFFRGLPKEIEEAAFIDGAGPFYTYIKVMMPNAVPAIITVLLFAFVWHYNDTFYTSLLMPQVNMMSTYLMALVDTYATAERDFNPLGQQMVLFAGVLLAIAPILTLYMFLQRYFVEGLERSGIVG